MAFETQRNASERSNRRLTTIVATDVCGYSSLSEQCDVNAINLVDDAYSLFEIAVNNYQGRIFKRVADGFLAEFQSAESAMHAAIEFTASVKGKSSSANMNVRTGIHVGDVTERIDGDLLGHGVNVAVRLQEQAHKNGILASHNIINLLGQNFPYEKNRRGALSLKNISKPIVAFDILDRSTTTLERLKSKVKVPIRIPMGVGMVFMLMLGFVWKSNLAHNANGLERRVKQIQATSFNDTSVSAYDNELNASYIYRILLDLSESKQPSDQSIFGLIETGDVDAAVKMLQTKLSSLDENDPKHLVTLHQIGALTYQRQPRKAIEIYKKIISIAPRDVAAITRLGRSYDVIGNVCRAREQYDMALDLTQKGTDLYIKLELDRAFNFIMEGNADQSLMILEPYVETMRQRKTDLLWSLFQTEYGIALERAGNTQLSEAVLSAIVHRQKKMGDDSNLSRSYNILGFLAVRKAQENPDLRDLFFNEAAGYFSKQMEIDRRTRRTHTLPGAHYFLGEIYMNLGEEDKAKEQFDQGLSIARKHEVMNFVFLNTLGIATVAYAQGNKLKTCENVLLANKIYLDRIDSGIGPKTRKKIKLLDCGFTYKPQPSLLQCSI